MDREKFTQGVLEAEDTMYRVSKAILISDADCEDAVQDAVLKAFSKLNSLREERYFKTWLIRILINECYRYKRNSKRLVPFDDTVNETAEKRDYSDLYRAVMNLKEPIRIVVTLHYIEGYAVREIGKMLKIPSGTVKSRLHTGRKILKEELQNG